MEGLEIAVTDVDILAVDLVPGVAVKHSEACDARGVIVKGGRDSVGKLTRGGKVARKDVGNSVSVLETALPHVDDALDVFEIITPGHIDNVAHVHKKDNVLKIFVDVCKHRSLVGGKLYLFVGQLAVLACGTADYDNGGIRDLCGLGGKLLRDGHFGMICRPGAPAAGLNGVFRDPILIDLSKLLVVGKGGVIIEALHNGYGRIVGSGTLSRTVTSREGIVLTASEDRNRTARLKGQDIILVFQNDDSFCRRLTGKGYSSGIGFCQHLGFRGHRQSA